MIGLIFGETHFPREILKKVKNRKVKYLIIDLTNGKFKKEKHSLCTKCIGYGLPVYNLGLNQDGWHDVANKKIAQLSKV